jgi:hypothetical protein
MPNVKIQAQKKNRRDHPPVRKKINPGTVNGQAALITRPDLMQLAQTTIFWGRPS